MPNKLTARAIAEKVTYGIIVTTKQIENEIKTYKNQALEDIKKELIKSRDKTFLSIQEGKVIRFSNDVKAEFNYILSIIDKYIK